MLHINKISIKNFRPYYDIKEFDFGEKNGVSIIFGDNGVGKSSLIRALKFVLYGELDSPDAFKMKNEINLLAWEEKRFDMYVALSFKYNNDNYSLKRSYSLRQNHEPKTDDDFESDLHFTKNRKMLDPNTANLILKNIIPKQISEYILFEGETINKYKSLLDNNLNKEIYESIRNILGVNVLKNSAADLEKKQTELQKKLTNLLKTNERNAKNAKELSLHQEALENFKEEKSKNDQYLLSEQEKLAKLENALLNHTRTRLLMEEIKNFKKDIERLDSEIVKEKEQIKKYLLNYKGLAKEIIDEFLLTTPSEIVSIRKSMEQNKKTEELFTQLSSTIETCKCILCNHDLSENEINCLKNDIDNLKNKRVSITESDMILLNNYDSICGKLNSLLNQIPPYPKNEVKNIENSIQTKILLKINANAAIAERNKQLHDQDVTKEFKKILEDYQKAKDNVKNYENAAQKLSEDIKSEKEKINEILKKIVPDLDTALVTDNLEKVKFLAETFQESIDLYSKKMRLKVQHDATELFKKISEEKEYDRLEFDDKYGLKLVDNKGRYVPNISSGYMTLITLSLIYGLHRNSSLTGTIILDAPFSVLTDFHRDNIIKTFNHLSDQVILLVYKDQIDIEKIREDLGNSLVNELEIYRDSIYKTNIRRLK